MNSRGRFAPYVLGTSLLAVAAVALIFVVYAAVVGEELLGFAVTLALSLPLGLVLRAVGRAGIEPTRREALATVLLTWLVVPLVWTLPFVITLDMSFLFALFETMSGFTTTGATILTDYEAVPASLFLWRATSQWVGGIGILVLFVAVFPQLAIAGRQMFYAEAPGPSEDRLTPRLRHTAAAVLSVYSGLSATCIAMYLVFGMSPTDAIAHAFATVSAGGFSNHALGFAYYSSPALEWTAVVFMFLAGVSLTLLYRTLMGRPLLPFKDAEFRSYTSILVIASAVLAVQLVPRYGLDGVRHAAFQAVSIMTTTGFASVDFAAWAKPSLAVLLVLMLIGGSAGSASGGIKVVRWLIIIKNTVREIRRTLHPRAVLPVRVGTSVVSEDVLRSVAAFITLYVGLFALSTLLLIMLGSDFDVALTASIASIGNVGPGFGHIGPLGSFAGLHPVSVGVLTFVMYAGRLEVVTVFVVFMPEWWRLPRHSPFRSWRQR